MKLKNILVPVDFSHSSSRVLKTAVDLAGAMDAKIHLLHVEEDVYRIREGHALSVLDRELVPIIDNFHATLLRECGVKLAALLKKLPDHLRGDAVTVEGHPTEVILTYIDEHNIDLEIVGKRGQSDIAGHSLGSTTEKIARKASCSVLIVKD